MVVGTNIRSFAWLGIQVKISCFLKIFLPSWHQEKNTIRLLLKHICLYRKNIFLYCNKKKFNDFLTILELSGASKQFWLFFFKSLLASQFHGEDFINHLARMYCQSRQFNTLHKSLPFIVKHTNNLARNTWLKKKEKGRFHIWNITKAHDLHFFFIIY